MERNTNPYSSSDEDCSRNRSRPHIYHLFRYLEHHLQPMNTFLDQLKFNSVDQTAVFFGPSPEKERMNATLDKTKRQIHSQERLYQFLRDLGPNEFIVFHGMYLPVRELLIQEPQLNSKIGWIAWGEDAWSLSYPGPKEQGITAKLKRNLFIQMAVKKFKCIGTLTSAESEMIQSVLGYEGPVIKLFYAVKLPDTTQRDQNDRVPNQKPVKVLIGNSGSPRNQHPILLNMLEKFKEENIRIYAPLGYGGDPTYVATLCELGHHLFKEKFIPLTELINPTRYTQFLDSMDIVLFGQRRQQGHGTLRSAIGLRKKIFLPSGSPNEIEYSKNGITSYATENIPNLTFKEFCHQDVVTLEKNRSACLRSYSFPKANALLKSFIEQLVSRSYGTV